MSETVNQENNATVETPAEVKSYMWCKLIPDINVVAVSAILDTHKSERCMSITDGDRLMSS
ncbi:hypothetical protein [Butyrivibrio sp. FCS014]|uniref:hypothetical protein n=1 Tax=Butyrivibrio sp. FCS014 TaxID=1408304 RepID=UPI000463FED3|nr:hypothetical protein [Butyrivibrio sp. FCS014]